jgi:protein-S-isoprenylcysteine O-methyltransferase Ste14
MPTAIVVCWIVFVCFWAATALRTKRTAERLDRKTALSYSIPTFLGAWLLLKGESDPGALGNRVLTDAAPVLAAGLALTLAGLALAIWARVTIGGNWSGAVTFKENHQLVRNGPYAWVRHPIYSAVLLMFLGSALATGTLGALVALPLVTLGIWLKLRQEEALMSRHFPGEYASYRSRVSALIPGVF